MSLPCERCALSGREPFVGLIIRPEESYEWCVSERDLEASKIRRPCPTRGRCTMGVMFSLEKCIKFYHCTI